VFTWTNLLVVVELDANDSRGSGPLGVPTAGCTYHWMYLLLGVPTAGCVCYSAVFTWTNLLVLVVVELDANDSAALDH